MLNSISNYVYERRVKLVRTAGIVGGLYLLGQYASARMADMSNRILEQRVARENMRKRFQQNIQDISFTVMTYMPLLSKHMLDEMDVEALIAELQSLSRASKMQQSAQVAEERQTVPLEPQHSPPAASTVSLESSVELVPSSDAQSETSSASFLSVSPQPEVLQSMEPTVEAPQPPGRTPQLAEASSLGRQRTSSVLSASLLELKAQSESGVSSSVVSGNDDSVLTDLSASQPSSSSRSKAELWREVKMLTVTRTLTVLYSITLLTLLLISNFPSLARLRRQYDLSLPSILSPPVDPTRLHDIEASLPGSEEGIWREGIDVETERKFLTLSWWILNVGWKDVGERVRRGVEEVFEGVSLKNKIGVIELHRLISDVRRRVEHEITFEGTERRINFLSTLLPPTSSALSRLLNRGGFPLAHSDTHEPAFTALLEETRELLTSPDFALVLERALDRATSLLIDGLSQNVFVGDEREEGEVRLRTAGVLPGLARWSSLALNGLPNELVDCLSDLHEVAGFAAIIYSNYGDHFR
ncbi:Peroxin-3 [Lactifluus volemus]|nr:Peroxin-3 [Lactifluus volemus]